MSKHEKGPETNLGSRSRDHAPEAQLRRAWQRVGRAFSFLPPAISMPKVLSDEQAVAADTEVTARDWQGVGDDLTQAIEKHGKEK